jgi:hypothetical protein
MFAFVFNILALNGFVPLTQADIWLRLLSVLVLIAINAFFVAAEFSVSYGEAIAHSSVGRIWRRGSVCSANSPKKY